MIRKSWDDAYDLEVVRENYLSLTAELDTGPLHNRRIVTNLLKSPGIVASPPTDILPCDVRFDAWN
jgi:hypothetical protein